jgi:hypothetical protein
MMYKYLILFIIFWGCSAADYELNTEFIRYHSDIDFMIIEKLTPISDSISFPENLRSDTTIRFWTGNPAKKIYFNIENPEYTWLFEEKEYHKLPISFIPDNWYRIRGLSKHGFAGSFELYFMFNNEGDITRYEYNIPVNY